MNFSLIKFNSSVYQNMIKPILYVCLICQGDLLSEEYVKPKSIFITGVAGFIGYSLADRLLDLGYQVYGCDNMNSYYDVQLKKDRLNLLQKKGLNFYKLDIRNISELKNLFLENLFANIVHLAAQAGVRHSLTHPQDYIDSNVDGFLQVLELCKDLPQTRLIYASSSSVYGDIREYPQNEEMNICSPNSLYSATKITNELFAKVYNHAFGVKSVGLRFFTVYGPWGRPDMAHYIFTDAIANGKGVSLFNGGELYRDFTYIDDITDGLLGVINSEIEFDVLNLGKGNPDKVSDLIGYLEAELKKIALIESKPLSKVEVLCTFADISKAKRIINYEPRINLKKGVRKYVEWHKIYYKVPLE